MIIYKPRPEERKDCYFVGLRLAWLYPEGTVLERRGHRWIKRQDRFSDHWGWWERTS